MNRRARTLHRSFPTRNEGFNRYLKPGALARLRDSRISARSFRFDSHSQISLYRSPSPSSPPSLSPTNSQPQVAMIDGFPCFAGRIYGPRCPQRKKLVATKSVFFLSSSPASPVSDSPDSIIDVFNTDILVAH
ncbi:hypothetical protein L1049_025231 [Liquidambar formosana]|uniref:Uncharacterized protein n=1 Tax=Liquidambar formosana TaxID=63359 RepID=A0AAP0X5E4_LIQFO